MHAIVVYSGKGGVGKTTVSALLAIKLADKHKVLLVDGDVNTPSISHIAGIERDNLRVCALPPAKTRGKTGVLALLSATQKVVAEYKPDVIIVDTPPSITEVHTMLFGYLKPSGVLYVCTPHKLSIEDTLVGRAHIEAVHGVLGLGCVVNMCDAHTDTESIGTQLSLTVLATVPLDAKYAAEDFTDAPGIDLGTPVKKLDPASFIQLVNNRAAALLVDKRTLKDFKKDDKKAAHKERMAWSEDAGTFIPRRFINLKTWDAIATNEMSLSGAFGRDNVDAFLEWNTEERLTKFVTRFATEPEPMFVLFRPPAVANPMLAFEVVVPATMEYGDDSYYGVPRAIVGIGGDAVTMFAHELSALPMECIREWLDSGHWFQVSATRWIPSWNAYSELANHLPVNCTLIEDKAEFIERVTAICEQEKCGVPALIYA